MQDNSYQEYEVYEQLRAEEEYWDNLAKKYLINQNGFFIFNEYEILKNNDIAESVLIGLKKYLLNKYNSLKIEKLH